jgi:hypothetical protein
MNARALFYSACALIISGSLFGGIEAHAQEPRLLPSLDQGWAQDVRNEWWRAPQGSRLIPLEWFSALEVADGKGMFSSSSNLTGLGFLRRPGATENDLPIGFAIDAKSDERFSRTRLRWKSNQRSDEKWLGLTCAACHTGAFETGGNVYLVDGAGSMSNFQKFIESFNQALTVTKSDPTKWDRFANRVLGPKRLHADGDKLEAAFSRLLEWQRREARINETLLRYGPGRIDAFGHIYNKVALTLDPMNVNNNPSDAPVSTPFIWRAPQLDRVQYNGVASKKVVGGVDIGAVGRNAGEVIGVFGDVVAHESPGVFNGYSSSVRVDQLIGLEQRLAKLRPPKWPGVLGPIDPAKAKVGEALFRTHCASCHTVIARTDLKTPIRTDTFLFNGKGRHHETKATLPPPGTDPWMACNAYVKKNSAGVLGGFGSQILTNGKIFSSKDNEPLVELLAVTVAAVIADQKTSLLAAAAREAFNLKQPLELEAAIAPAKVDPRTPNRTKEKRDQYEECMAADSPLLGYSSRPLNGVWATAPYLHNGSVPNMYQLLLPPAERMTQFPIGTIRYDAKVMGFSTAIDAPGNSETFYVLDPSGRYIDGNANSGHDYENDKFTSEQRYQIIEYIKTL